MDQCRVCAGSGFLLDDVCPLCEGEADFFKDITKYSPFSQLTESTCDDGWMLEQAVVEEAEEDDDEEEHAEDREDEDPMQDIEEVEEEDEEAEAGDMAEEDEAEQDEAMEDESVTQDMEDVKAEEGEELEDYDEVEAEEEANEVAGYDEFEEDEEEEEEEEDMDEDDEAEGETYWHNEDDEEDEEEEEEDDDEEELTEAQQGMMKKVLKEGGKRGVEIEGAADMGGLRFFCCSVDEPDGDLALLKESLKAMNAKADPSAEERKGGSGHVGKMIFRAGTEQLAVVAYMPKADECDLDCEEWLEEVLSSQGGEVLSASSRISTGRVLADPVQGIFPLKIRESMILKANDFLRARELFPEADDDDDEIIFGDDDFPTA